MIERKKLGIIIEARTNSKKIKNKILKKIFKNYSVLDYILKRLKTKNYQKYSGCNNNKKNDVAICKICKRK